MASYPSISAYNKAVASLQTSAADAALRRLRPELRGQFGQVRVISGGFALTYPLSNAAGERFALRCFQDEQPDRARRYEAIVPWIAALAPEARRHFVSCRWLPEALRVGTASVPAVLMSWAPGVDLGLYLEQHHQDPTALHLLLNGLDEVADLLEREGCSHGDLQVGNVFVADDGHVTLIDYDGMWLPALDALPSHEHGHINFQHPEREEHRAGPGGDRFSLIVIDLAVRALIAEPSLWDEYATGENVLFGQADFVEPAASALVDRLLRNATTAVLTRRLVEVAQGPYGMVPALREFRREVDARLTETASAGSRPEAAETERAGADARRDAESYLPATAAPRPVAADAASATAATYRSQYPVLRATAVASIARHEGRKVEVVGRVEDVRNGFTKYGDPYVFINFDDWRGDIFKVTIWSDGLQRFATRPDSSWKGRWVSAVGLIDEPFTNDRYGYTHQSMTIESPTQVHVISAAEAEWRLGGARPRVGGAGGGRSASGGGGARSSGGGGTNRGRGASSGSGSRATDVGRGSTVSANRERLEGLKPSSLTRPVGARSSGARSAASATRLASPSGSRTLAHRAGGARAPAPQPSPSPEPPVRRGCRGRVGLLLVAIAAAVLWIAGL